MSTDSTTQSKTMFERFLHSQVAGSIFLMAFTVAALVWANSPWAEQYFALAKTKLGLSWGEQRYEHSLGHWIKDGLMAIFFFVVGLEIKREVVVGELSSLRRAALPVTAALGGAIVPALLYIALNGEGQGARGWGVPMATDIAFALGIMALFGSRAPTALKVFLTALAIADDLLAVLVIALFYTESINLVALGGVGLFLVLIVLAGRLGVRRISIYLLMMTAAWACMEASGVHATVAGVLIALVVPVRSLLDPDKFFAVTEQSLVELRELELTRESTLHDSKQRKALSRLYLASEDMMPAGIALEHQLHPIQSFLILPLFALFSAGVAFSATTFEGFPGSISLGIIIGLIVGKQVGITLFSWLAIRLGLADLPPGVTWFQLWAVSALAGIGFTMSIFVGDLAFADPALIDEAKIGIFIASLISGILGYLLLNKSLPKTAAGQ